MTSSPGRWDQGPEMRDWKQINVAAGIKVYFCDPHAPWQRGTNENTNGLLRQYFPRGTDFSTVTEAQLDAVADELNDRPASDSASTNPPNASPSYRCHSRSNPPNPQRTASRRSGRRSAVRSAAGHHLRHARSPGRPGRHRGRCPAPGRGAGGRGASRAGVRCSRRARLGDPARAFGTRTREAGLRRRPDRYSRALGHVRLPR